MSQSSIRRQFKSPRNREAFNRWHDHQIEQLSNVSAIVFTLASAGLAYSLSLLSEDKAALVSSNLLAIRVFTFAFGISFLASIAFALNRLEDFRRTKNIVRLRDDDPKHPELPGRRRVVDRIELYTWILFYAQVLTFTLGGITILVFLWCNYANKL